MELAQEQFFNQFSQLADLSSVVPEDAQQIAKEKVGSLLLTAVPLEGMGLSTLLQSSIGQTGTQALKTIGSAIANRLAPTPTSSTAGQQDTELEDVAAEEPEVVDLAPAAAEALGAATADVGATVASVTLGTVLDTIPVVGPFIGLLTTLGIGLHDLLDKPRDPPPIYSSSQFGV